MNPQGDHQSRGPTPKTHSERPAGASRSNRSRRRFAAGPKRPRYLSSPDLDRMMIMLVALMAEVAALRDRVDTHEALGAAGKPVSPAEVESFVASAEQLAERDIRRLAMIRRVMRVMFEELEGPARLDSSRLRSLLQGEPDD